MESITQIIVLTMAAGTPLVLAALGELERESRYRGCCAVFDGQGEVLTVPAEVEVRVAPGMKLRNRSRPAPHSG